MNESDEVNEQIGRSVSTVAMVASRVGEPIARAIQERNHRSAELAAERSREVLARFEAERALVRTELVPIAQNYERWAERATARDAVELHRVASQWRDHDDVASYIAQAVETRAPQRFGLRTMAELETRLDADLARENLASRQQETTAQPAQASPAVEADRQSDQSQTPGTPAPWSKVLEHPRGESYVTDEGQLLFAWTSDDRRIAALQFDAAQSEAARERREQSQHTAEAAELLLDADRAERDVDAGVASAASPDTLRAQVAAAEHSADRAGQRAGVAEEAVSVDRERQARIEQSVDGIDPEGSQARSVAARGNAHPPKAAAVSPAVAPRARAARGRARGTKREATLGR
jgi:hypothetical protein